MLFADLLSLHLVTFLMFFILVSIYNNVLSILECFHDQQDPYGVEKHHKITEPESTTTA